MSWVRSLLSVVAAAIVVAGCSGVIGMSSATVDTGGDGGSWDPSRGLISGTAFFDSDIIIESDRSTFEEITFVGRETRYVFDRRVGDDDSREGGEYHEQPNTYVFEASYEDLPGINAAGRSFAVVEVLVNPEFDMDEAGRLAESYASLLGQLPAMLRSVVEDIVIH